MFGITKKMFIELLSNIVNGSNHRKCVSLSNQKRMTQHTLINLHPNKYIVINNCRCRCYEIKDLLYDKIHVYFYQ